MDAPTITLGAHPVTLDKPSTFTALALARTRDAIMAMPDPEFLAIQATAIAVCWPKDKTWPGSVRPRDWKPSLHVGEYGAGVFDDLVGAGLPMTAIFEAGKQAHRWAMSTLPAAKEVEQAEGFTEAPTGG